MKKGNLKEVTAVILAKALGKSLETAQGHLRAIRKMVGKKVGFQFVTVPNTAQFYKMSLDECYVWLGMTP